MTPAFRIIVGGQDASGAVGDRLLALTVTDNDGGTADQVVIDLDDRDGRIATPDMDATLEVSLGFAGGPLAFLGSFSVTGVGGTGPDRTMRITGTAADLKGDIRSPRTRAWEGKTLSDIVRTIAGESGLKPVVGESLASAAWGYLAQTAESNLNFLTRIAGTLDATAKPAGGALIVQRRGEGKTAAGDVLTPPVITSARLSSYDWSLDGREIYGAVEAQWCDTAGGALNRITVGSGTPRRVLRHVYQAEAEARRAAQATLSGAARSAMTIRNARLSGFEPGLLAGATARLAGPDLRPELIGEWQITRVIHSLTGSGLITGFDGKKGAA
jgi:phage protein D